MSELIAEKYGSLLRKGDVIELFKLMENKAGEDIEKITGLKRWVFYDWRVAKQKITSEVKRDLLCFLLEKYPIDTLMYLVDKGIKRTVELLSILLCTVYENAMNSVNRKEFDRFYKKFLKLTRKYDASLISYVSEEIEDMKRVLYERWKKSKTKK